MRPPRPRPAPGADAPLRDGGGQPGAARLFAAARAEPRRADRRERRPRGPLGGAVRLCRGDAAPRELLARRGDDAVQLFRWHCVLAPRVARRRAAVDVGPGRGHCAPKMHALRLSAPRAPRGRAPHGRRNCAALPGDRANERRGGYGSLRARRRRRSAARSALVGRRGHVAQAQALRVGQGPAAHGRRAAQARRRRAPPLLRHAQGRRDVQGPTQGCDAATAVRARAAAAQFPGAPGVPAGGGARSARSGVPSARLRADARRARRRGAGHGEPQLIPRVHTLPPRSRRTAEARFGRERIALKHTPPPPRPRGRPRPHTARTFSYSPRRAPRGRPRSHAQRPQTLHHYRPL
mmetsp:Transcript_28716/g.98877  ORF Transcript_28716/g.98877 Transcript_28716/m.98877 type:complete len:350 (+) Transcript_28716:61-1110(+)